MNKKLFVILFLISLFSFRNDGAYAVSGAFVDAPMQKKQVSGIVTDAQGEPIIGANVLVEGTTNGVITDMNGNFRIEIPEGAILLVSYIGYVSQKVKTGVQANYTIRLVEDARTLDEVVVTALGIRKDAKKLGYAFTKVDGDELTKMRNTNFANSLTAKIAGVNVSNIASGPGSSSRVTIRGNTSISGDNQPLYVINGIPLDNTQFGNAGMWGGIDFGDNISGVNPDDIEEMTVLKGATAAALYGSRAKNGAIIIVTKTGKADAKLAVEYNGNFVFDMPYYLYDFQKEFGQGLNNQKPIDKADALRTGQNSWGAPLDGSMVIQYDGVERPYVYQKDKLLDDFYQTGTTFANNVSFTGGMKGGSFRLGLTNMRNKGIVQRSGVDRNNISLGVVQELANKITVTANIDYISEKVKNRPGLSDAPGNPVAGVLFVANVVAPETLKPGYDADYQEVANSSNYWNTNPYFYLNRFSNLTRKERFIGVVNVRWNILDWLFVQGKVGQDFFEFRATNIVPDGTAYRLNGTISESNIKFLERNFEFLAGMEKRILEDFNINFNVGGNQMINKREDISISASEFVIPQKHVLNNTKTRNTTLNRYNKQVNSLFGILELSYKDYLYLNITGRNDWFSTLDKHSNNYFYPSVGLSFLASDAFELPAFISFAKARLAYASVGGDTSPYQLYQTYSLESYTYENQPLGRLDQAAVLNKNLKPLSVNEFEFGIDLRMFNNRFGIDFAVYDKRTKDDITSKSITAASGYSSVLDNVGELRNRGVELLLNGEPIRSKAFSWNTSLNLAYNKSKVIRLADGVDELTITQSRTERAWIKHIVGKEYAQIVGYTYKRNANGEVVHDANGLPLIDDQLVSFGSGMHKLTGGFSNIFRYKDFTLSVLIDFKFGGKIYSASNYNFEGFGLSKNTLEARRNGITGVGVNEAGEKNTVHIEPENVRNYYVARRRAIDDYVYDAGFIKLRDVTLSYDVPRHWLAKTKFIKSLTISALGKNLWVIKKDVPNIDPESNFANHNGQGVELSQIPGTRSVGFNLNVKF